jgi:unsaturated chondroitin disaccharide hydrolase
VTDQQKLLEKCQKTFKFAEKQLKHLVETHPDYFPLYTENGKWKHGGAAWTNWCEGFLPGQLWLIYGQNSDPYFREKAEHYCRLIEHRKTDTNVHDLGFLFWSSWKRWYDLTGDSALNEVIIEAGRTAGSRLREKGQYLPSFVAPESIFIDIMMNVGIIFYAARQSNDPALWERAVQHCLTTRRYLVRGDGSTSHEGIFNTETGEFLRQTTHQGYRDDSSWARGLTWALYGFGTVYKFTGDPRFLQTAEATANYYIKHTPDHGVPPNDWSEPDPRNPFESSAAAIAASGLLQLAQITGDPLRARFYHDYALTIVDTLTEPQFLGTDDGYEGILKHGMYHERNGLGVDESVMWGEYFFLEAVSKVIADVSE